jgi:hypothetical protein
MSEENERIVVPYRKPELAFENTSTGLQLIGCSKRNEAKENPIYCRCRSCASSGNCPYSGISVEQAGLNKEVAVTKIFNGKSLVHSILSKLRDK